MISLKYLFISDNSSGSFIISQVKRINMSRKIVLLSCLFSLIVGRATSESIVPIKNSSEYVELDAYDEQNSRYSVDDRYIILTSSESVKHNFCIELEYSILEISCYNADDARINVEQVTSGASVTVKGVPYDPEMRYAPGQYHLEASLEGEDNEDCYFSEWIEFVEPEPVSASIEHTNVSCPGMNDGTITVYNLSLGADYVIQANGAVGPYLDSENLLAGTYWVTVFVASQGPPDTNEGYKNDCIYTYAVRVGEPEIDYEIKPYFEDTPYCPDSPNALKRNQLFTKYEAPGYTATWIINKMAIDNGWNIDFITEYDGWGEVGFSPGIGEATFTLIFTNEEGCRKEYDYKVQSPDC